MKTEIKVKSKPPKFFTKNNIIGVDLDGVIGNFLERFSQIAFSKYGTRLEINRLPCYWIEKCTSLSEKQVLEILSSQKLYKSISPFPFARTSLNTLHKSGCQIHIVTDRPTDFYKITNNWLRRNGFVWDRLVLVKAKDKSSYAYKNNITCFVEDRYDTAISLANSCKEVYLFDRSYNQGELPQNVKRVSSWSELLQIKSPNPEKPPIPFL